MLTRGTAADVIVLGLVGERGREVRGFLEHDLGPEGRKRSVVVVSTSDNPPLLRMRAAYTATSIAEYFRDQGQERPAADGLGDPLRHGAARSRPGGGRAADDQGLSAVGVRRAAGAARARRRGARARAASPRCTPCSWTATITTSRLPTPSAPILDGHVVLSRDLASRNHYPADRRAAQRQPHDAGRDRRRATARRPGIVRELDGGDSRHRGSGQRRRLRARRQPEGGRGAVRAPTRSRRSCVSPPTRCAALPTPAKALQEL